MLIWLTFLVPGLLPIIGMLIILLWRCRIVLIFWTYGRRQDFSSIGGFEVAGAGVYLPAAEVAFESSVWGVTSFGDLASFHLERCLGAYPVDFDGCWTPPEYWDADEIALEMSEYPDIWTDGSSRCSRLFTTTYLVPRAGTR